MQDFYKSMGRKKDNRGALVGFIVFIILIVGNSIVKSGNLLFYIIGLGLGILIYFIFDWLERRSSSRPASLGRDFKKKYPIIIQYAPPKGINPAEAGLLYNRKVDPTDLTSLIYQWKFEKLIDIKTFVGENSNKEFIKLIKKEEMPLMRPLFESEIFDSLFLMGNVKIIEGAFQLRYALMLEDLEYHGIKKGWIYRSTLGSNWKYIYNFLLVLLFFLFYYLFVSIEARHHFPQFLFLLVVLFLACVFLGGLVYGGGRLKFTEKGAKIASYLIGYRNFIKSCDKNKIKLLLKEDPLFVDRTLPYATAFGLETEFLKKVSPLKKDWNAKYFRGQKIPHLGVLRFFFGGGDDDNSFF